MIAIFLGGPLHRTTREQDAAPAVIREKQPLPVRREFKNQSYAGCDPKRSAVVELYRRHDIATLPGDFVVYLLEGYEPDPDDEQCVLEAAGDCG